MNISQATNIAKENYNNANNIFNFNRSLFTVDSYKSAIGDANTNGYAVVKITPMKRVGLSSSDSTIIGVIQNPISFRIDAAWEKMGGITGLIPFVGDQIRMPGGDIAGKYLNAFGFGDVGEVFASRLVYKKSGYLTLSINMKVVDWNGTSQPVRSTMLLSYMCLPDTTFGKEAREEVLNALGNMLDAGVNELEQVEQNVLFVGPTLAKGTQMVYEGAKKIVNGAVSTIKDVENQANKGTLIGKLGSVLEDVGDYTLLRSSPPTVTIDVGQFFSQSDMVIKSVDFTFSKEMTKVGPLYVDINLEVSSRKILGDISDLGLKIGYNDNSGNGRVIFENTQQTKQNSGLFQNGLNTAR